MGTGKRRYINNNVPYTYNKNQQDALFHNFILVKNSTCFGDIYCPSSGVLILYSLYLVFSYCNFKNV